jgi:hypothetical protein
MWTHKLAFALLLAIAAEGAELPSVFHRMFQDFWNDGVSTYQQPSTPIPAKKPVPFQADDNTSLTLETFETFAAQYDALFVNYCSSTTGICHHVAPEWNQFTEMAARLFPTVGVAKVDCVEEPVLCRRKNIKNYPTLQWYDQYQILNYHGVLSADHFVKITAQNMNLTANIEYNEGGVSLVSVA